jgi:hypothetical protein
MEAGAESVLTMLRSCPENLQSYQLFIVYYREGVVKYAQPTIGSKPELKTWSG